ncbi:MAG: urea ABC transporter permease subunit UrtB [Stappiaceae bacterium]
MKVLIRALVAVFLIWCLSFNTAQAADTIPDLVNALSVKGFKNTEATIGKLTETGDPAVATVLNTLSEGNLYFRKSDNQVFRAEKSGKNFKLFDPLSGNFTEELPRSAVKKIRVNNKLRRIIRAALGGLTLQSSDPTVRKRAVESVFKQADPASIKALDSAIAAETDQDIKKLMVEARAAAVLRSDLLEPEKIQAIKTLADRGDQEARGLIMSARSDSASTVKDAADEAVAQIDRSLALWGAGQNIWYGLSLGSVLLLAAIGLAITFGVMGVINMAHGEMVMIGAYTTFVVQELIRTSAPALFDYSLAIALPVAFLVAGMIGIAIERGIIRFLYGRPLETLLATWGLSLILQQTVRSIFGPTNREVGNPGWMSGAFDLGQMTITNNRLWIIVFSLLVFALLILVLKKTPFGLYMRAVTQNRKMASNMGIRTPWVDALTFGLGSGIAGIAGVALSQIDNVSPNLGQSYIIDSFMVVVFGGVGNLWGTLVGAMTLGVVNKFLEPYAGAVLGKILVLVFIILFIQKRPRGLFALKGRAVEA